MFSRLRSPRAVLILLAGLGSISTTHTGRADLIRLKTGGEIRGAIPRDKGATTGPEVTITTLAGTVVTIGQEQVDFITRRPIKIEEYETRARRAPDTIDAQWALAEWCRENNLATQRDIHLERIIQIDPDHEKAHYGLGHTNVDGVWMSREERMTAQGYVKHKGRWVTPQELELLEKTEEERKREEKWFQRVYLWKNWLTGTHAAQSREALKSFQELKDPDAVPALVKNFQDEEDKRLRGLYISILENMAGPKPVPALVAQSLHDVDYKLRYKALNAIQPDQYEAAVPLYVRELQHDLNAIVGRAAQALEKMADDRQVPYLIEALVTTHRYKVAIPDNGGLGFRSDGGGVVPGGGAILPPEIELGLRAGQYNGVIIHQPTKPKRPPKIVTVSRDEQNREVLAALQKITGENFGYNERTWKAWHAGQKNGAGNVPALP